MFESIKDISVKTLLSHLVEQPIEHYIKQFTENRFINPDKDKDTEDIIRLYWGFQDIFKNQGYIVNPIQQRLEKYLNEHPQYIKKLYNCRSQFQHQQIKYTESVQAIVKFGRYSMFTTEFDPNVISPVSNGTTSWGEKTGIAAKQLCIVVANEDTTFIRSMTDPDDKKYAIGLSRMMKTFSTANNVKYVNASQPHMGPNMTMLDDSTFIDHISTRKATEQVNNQREKEADKYDIVYGDPFIQINTLNNSNTISKGMTSNDTANTYTGVLSVYCIFETYTFQENKYKEYLEEYIQSNRFRAENPQLYSYVWNRFSNYYDKLIRAYVDRAIIIAHQSMVDFLISIHEKNYTIPQLMMYFAPGTMVNIKTEFDVPQSAMVLSENVRQKDGNLTLMLQVLCLNTTKIENMLIHDVYTMSDYRRKNRVDNYLNITATSNRGGTIFKYFILGNTISLMHDEDVEKQLMYVKNCLKMLNAPAHMELDGSYYFNEWIHDQRSKENKIYNGRIIVDYEYSRSSWNNIENTAIHPTITFSDVHDKCDINQYKNNITLPGAPCILTWSDTNAILVTADDLLTDIRYMLSLPIVTTAYILNDKKWAIVKLSDIHETKYQESAYENVVMDDSVKEFIKILASTQDKNTFKDIISNKEGGCIFLLIGNAACGKSSSAEAIAEVLHKPLYKITSGELGNSVWEMEERLRDILNDARRWNAIVLIDEADIYLQNRKDKDLHNNAMVSIFLRQLELFNGVMFLTSNRDIKEIDPAFKSRIIQTFYFHDLTKEDRKKIWINLLKCQDMTVTDKQADTLSEATLNGRQIKNIIKAAIANTIYYNKKLDYDTIYETMKFMIGTDEKNEELIALDSNK